MSFISFLACFVVLLLLVAIWVAIWGTHKRCILTHTLYKWIECFSSPV